MTADKDKKEEKQEAKPEEVKEEGWDWKKALKLAVITGVPAVGGFILGLLVGIKKGKADAATASSAEPSPDDIAN